MDLAVNCRGSVAWIVHDPFTSPVVYEVYKADSSTTSRLLDSGADIGPTSLSRTGSRITWRHGAGVRSAALR